MRDKNFDIVLIGASAGGMNILPDIISGLKEFFPLPIIIVNHLAPSSDNYFVSILKNHTSLKVKEADEKEDISKGYIYTSPPNYHLLIEDDRTFCLSVDQRYNYARPSIDLLFFSAAEVYKSKTIAVILTGANNDGAKGSEKINKKGGILIVQDPSTAYMPIMPQSVIDLCKPDFILSPEKIANQLNSLVN